MIDRQLIEVIALAFGLALAIAMAAFFSIAFAYGGSITLSVNEYGEMWPEMVLMWFVVWPTMTVALHRYVQH